MPDLPIVDKKHPRQKIAQAEWIQLNRFILAAYGEKLRIIDPTVSVGGTTRSLLWHRNSHRWLGVPVPCCVCSDGRHDPRDPRPRVYHQLPCVQRQAIHAAHLLRGLPREALGRGDV